MSEQKTVGKMLRLLRLLVFNVSKPIAVVAQRSDMSIRTVYRYLETFKSAGMTVTRRYGTVYTVELGVLEDPDEAGKPNNEALKKLEKGIILQKPCQDLKMPRDTYQVLEQMDEEKILDDAPYLKRAVANVSLLQNAVEMGRKVKVTYDSNRWGKRMTRVIEPYDFFFYYNYVWCYDCDKKKNLPLRISRMGEVNITDEPWSHGQRHNKQVIDAFGCWGHTTMHIKLRMTMQARNLMTEAHPLSMIDMKEDTRYKDGKRWILETNVCSYEGLTRYIMGMLDEIEILEGEGLKEYIQEWREKISAVEI